MPPIFAIPDGLSRRLKRLTAGVKSGDFGLSCQELQALDLRGRLRAASTAFARDGLGTPLGIHGYYLLKAALYLLGFGGLLGRSGLRRLLSSRDFRREAFRRFVVYNLLFEVLGLGCGSGPLAGRLMPPHTAWFYWFCPGTMKLPLRANARDSPRPLLPWLSTRRTRLDVCLFAGYVVSIVRALVSERVTAGACRWICSFLAALAVVDHTAFLASRGEVYGYMLATWASGAPLAGAQCVQLAIYFWAGVSKLGPWFKHVISVMLTNSPAFPRMFVPMLYRDREAGDLRASRVAAVLAHAGAGMEFAIPLLLPWGGRLASLGMFCSVSMHSFIFANLAAGVPQEWNIFTPTAVWHLFLDAHEGMDWRGLRSLPREHPLLTVFMACSLGLVQLAGSLYPPSNSFLTSMKYYAGNWPITIWMVKRSAWHKLDKLRTLSGFLPQQTAATFGDKDYIEQAELRLYAFRALHLPYRCLPQLLEVALQGRPIKEFQYMEGELMAAAILGYNFGDGYLSGRYMCQAVQDICGFEAGELLHISIDGCPALGNWVPWAVRDATQLWDDSAALAVGKSHVRELEESQPY